MMREGLQHQPLDGDLPPARRASAMIDFKYERRKEGPPRLTRPDAGFSASID